MPDLDDQIPAVDVFAVIKLDENDDQPVVSFEYCSPFAEPFSLKPIVNFARPRGWFVQVEPTPSEFFYQVFTTEFGVRRFGYFLSTWAKGDGSMYSAVTIVTISNYFQPNVFKALLLELNLLLREDSKLVGKTIEKSVVTLLCNTLSTNCLQDFGLVTSRHTHSTTDNNVCVNIFDLFSHLGMQSIYKVIQAVLSDCRVVLTSRSPLRLSKAQSAILSLIQPFDYMQTCITILPENLCEILNAPTPFLIGVLSDFELEESEDYILVEIDTGNVVFPENVTIYHPEKIFTDRLFRRLQNVIFPGSEEEDFAICRKRTENISPEAKEKRLRACFLLYFAELIYGYQYFILYNKRNVSENANGVSAVSFHSSAFLGFRCLNDQFINHVLNSQYFNAFVSSRANFTRKPDAFDKIFNMTDLGTCLLSKKYVLADQDKFLDVVVSGLSEENTFSSFLVASQESFSRLRAIETETVAKTIQYSSKFDKLKNDLYSRHLNGVAIQTLPVPDITSLLDFHEQQNKYHAHRNQVLTNCMENLLGKATSPSRKVLKAVQLSMRFPCLRVHFCRLLEDYSNNNSILDTTRFEILAQLVNVALENESVKDEYGVVYKIMHLSFIYCRKLQRGAYQYLYTAIQDHKVWTELNFWNNCFYYDVHMASFASTSSCNEKDPSVWRLIRVPCILEVLAKENRQRPKSPGTEENDIILAQCKHYINLMIGLQTPLNIYSFKLDHDKTLTNDNSVQEKLEEIDLKTEKAAEQMKNISSQITKTLDHIFLLTGRKNDISRKHINDYVEMHAESLQDVFAESSTLGSLVNNGPDVIFVNELEHLVSDPLKCFLLANHHDVPVMDEENRCSILPAKGAFYVTNYRLIFKGRPLNPTLSDEIVVCTIPILAVDTFKKTSLKKVQAQIKTVDDIDSAILATSKLCHVMKLAFDSQISITAVEKLVSQVHELCHKAFAYTSVRIKMDALPHNDERKSSVLTPLRRLEGMTKKRTDTWKFRDFSLHRGSFSPSLDISDIDTNAISGPDVHRHFAAIDYFRLGFAVGNAHFRVTYANSDYKICANYPSALIVPAEISDVSLAKIAKGFLDNRFPTIVWANNLGAFIARSGGVVNRTVVKKLKKAVTHGKTATNTMKTMSLISGGSQQTINSKASSGDDSGSVMNGGALKSNDAQNYYLSIMAGASLKNEEDRIFRKGSMESISTLGDNHSAYVDNDDMEIQSVSTENEIEEKHMFKRTLTVRSSQIFKSDRSKKLLEAVNLMKRSPMYLLIEKGSHIKSRPDSGYDVIQMKSIKDSTIEKSLEKVVDFLKLDKDDPNGDNCHDFFTRWENTGWPELISNILMTTNAMTSLIKLNNSSIVLSMDNERSYSAQLSSLSQLLLDPFYRTFDGFQVLVEKEWLAYGYNFSRTEDSTGVAFILFLDCVHQVQAQFPSAFEFSSFYLRFLAYHSVSGFFRTFLESSEQTRINLEVLAPEPNDQFGCVIWHYIKKQNTRSAIFLNPEYSPTDLVLTPSHSMARIEIWELFTEEGLHHGSPYDIESAEAELQENKNVQDENERCYVNSIHACNELYGDYFSEMIKNVGESRKNFSSQWAQRREQMNDDKLNTENNDAVHYAIQKKNALNVFRTNLENGDKTLSKEENKPKKEHSLSTYHAGIIPAKCGKCSSIITRWSKALECKKCHFQVHVACVNREFTTFGILHVNNLKMEEEAIEIPDAAILNESMDFSQKIDRPKSADGNTMSTSDLLTLQVPTPPLCTGYLSKQGAKLKLWSPRYFVLYPDIPKIFYYEEFEEWKRHQKSCGFVDLADFRGLTIEETGRRAIMELRTGSKNHRLMAEDKMEAQRWRECIEQVVKE